MLLFNKYKFIPTIAEIAFFPFISIKNIYLHFHHGVNFSLLTLKETSTGVLGGASGVLGGILVGERLAPPRHFGSFSRDGS